MRTILFLILLLITSTAAASPRIEVSVVTDWNTVQSYGSVDSTRNTIDRLMKDVATVYKTQFDYDIVIMYVQIPTSNASDNVPADTNMTSLQEAMIKYRAGSQALSSSDITLLITNRRLVNNVSNYEIAGFAMHSSICTNHAAAVVRDLNTGRDYLTVSHEIGHVLGAEHDEEGKYVMALSPASENFSVQSSTAIKQTVTKYGTCLDAPVTAQPPATSSGGGGNFGFVGVLGLGLIVAFRRRKWDSAFSDTERRVL